MSDLPLVVCDVETTGLSADNHRVIEVSYVRVDRHRWDDFAVTTHRFELSPQDYARGEPRAYAVNGYRRGHPDWQGVPLLDSDGACETWRRIEADLTDVILLNQNVSFDARFLMAEMSRHRPRALDEAPWRDFAWEVGAFSKRHMKAAGLKGWKLHDVYELLTGPALPPHRAEADVLRAIWVMAEGVRLYPEIWADFRMDVDGAKEAVRRWSRGRVAQE